MFHQEQYADGVLELKQAEPLYEASIQPDKSGFLSFSECFLPNAPSIHLLLEKLHKAIDDKMNAIKHLSLHWS